MPNRAGLVDAWVSPWPGEGSQPRTGPTFQETFEQALQKGVSFSKHAIKRLESRHLEMGAIDVAKLNGALEKLDQKGARSSLVLTDDKALIVNVKERKVVTAMDRQAVKENVFTNIDSTIVI